MSNQITSAAISQISKDRDINAILGELLQAEGSKFYIFDISKYLDLHTNNYKETYQSFQFVELQARQKNKIYIGYKPYYISFSEASELVFNPPHKDLKSYQKVGNFIIVLVIE